MTNDKTPIHTTILKETKEWLKKDAALSCKYIGESIDTAVAFYKVNKSVIDEYNHARSFLKELCKEELEDDFESAKPMLKRMIDEAKLMKLKSITPP